MKQKHESKSKKSHQETPRSSRSQASSTAGSNQRKESRKDAQVEDDMILRR